MFAEAVREDIRDPEFIRPCDEQAQRTGKHLWSLALAKVPEDLRVVARPAATKPPTQAPPPVQPSLPATGSVIERQVMVGVGMLFVGAVILLLARRRRAH